MKSEHVVAVAVAAVVVAAAAAAAAAHSNGDMTNCREVMIHKAQEKESVQNKSWMYWCFRRRRSDQHVVVVANEVPASRVRVHECLGHVQVLLAGRSKSESEK
jgi:hypothetical protein